MQALLSLEDFSGKKGFFASFFAHTKALGVN